MAREPLQGGGADATGGSAPLSARLQSPSHVNSFTVEGLVASMPVLRRLTSQETYYCQICLSNCPATDGFQLRSCQHLFCSHCLQGYVQTKLPEAALCGALLCPFLPELHAAGGLNAGCRVEIPDDEVQRLCGEETLAQLQRFRAMRQDETYRECPSCQARVLGGAAGRRHRALTCPQCSLVFCFIHANAHPGQSCWQFEMSQRLTQLKAAVHLAAVSRRCPSCSMKIIKDGGCNHMTCAFCGAHFCWLCGRHLTGEGTPVQRHYESWNFCGCPGMQMQEGFGRCPTYCLTPCMCCFRIWIPFLYLLLRLVHLVLTILWPALWLVFFVLMTPWCFFFYCLRCLGFHPCCQPGRVLANFWNFASQQHCDSDCCDSD